MKTILLCLTCLCMLYGVWIDIKIRKFPNRCLLLILVLGSIYSGINHQFNQAFLLFLAINFVGIFAHQLGILSAGDIKFTSTFVFFLNGSASALLILISCILVIGLGVGFIAPYFRYDNKDELKSHYQQELNNIRLFIYTGKAPITKSDDLETWKKSTYPFTVQLLCAFILTLILCQFFI